MTTLAAQVPDHLARLAHEVAARERISVDQVVERALSAQLAAWPARDTVAARAARANLKGFDDVMAKVPDVPPMPGDELP